MGRSGIIRVIIRVQRRNPASGTAGDEWHRYARDLASIWDTGYFV